ncbi:nuclear autoantigen Sp-100-like isoform X3 [Mesocricetus auratus]|uniref:Nuclear autoantigen Sp-100-like isoform X3 n=1 Tax=Mesocricetus auratus TaxID=10036 RepID=A0ABM2Y614_MESAU|nr:nuclear autoantigen Sp-100-like isoform X3 [Mesocricetus auratus]
MSTEQENTEGIPFETLFPHFKRYKVAISQAIKKPFPFLAFLRDNELISDKMYQDFQDSCTNLVPVEQVVYRALEELEKRLDLVVLGVLFSEENVKAYPDLEHILQSFQSVLQNKLCSQGSDRGDPNSQLSLDQVLSLPENEFSEDLYGKEQTDQGRRDTTGDNTDGLERDQAAMRQGPDSEPEESCELEVHQSNSDAPMEPHSPQPWDEERPQLRTQGTQVYPGSMNLGDIKQENSSFVLNGEETQASSSHNQASEAMDLSIEDSDGGINCSEESTSGICQSDIMQGNSSFAPDGEETESRTSYDQASEIIDLSIEDSDDGINYLEESTSGTCQSDIMQENSSFVSDGEETESRTSYDQASETIDLSIEDSDDGINYLEESTSDICQSSPRIRRQFNVNFVCPELPVTCGTAKGTLYKEKFEQGTGEKSILSETGEWLTLREFEIKGNRGNSKKWKQSIRCYGWPLKELIEDGHLPDLPGKRRKSQKFDNLGVTVGSQFEKTFERTLSINNTGEPQSSNNHIVLLT